MQKLKPCPFCGGEAEAEVYEPCNDYPMNAFYKYAAHVSCNVCRASPPSNGKQYQTEEEALAVVTTAWNTRPAAPVDGLETLGYVHRGTIGLLLEGAVSKAAIAPTSGGDFKHPVVFGEQAEAIIAAEQNRAEVAEYKLDQAINIVQPMIIQRAERAEADNAALTARVDEYETGLVQMHQEMSALETQLAAAKDLISRAQEIIPGNYMNWHGFARAALEEKP